jgi:hypothetical protein
MAQIGEETYPIRMREVSCAGIRGQEMPLAVYVYVEVAEGASKPCFGVLILGIGYWIDTDYRVMYGMTMGECCMLGCDVTG